MSKESKLFTAVRKQKQIDIPEVGSFLVIEPKYSQALRWSKISDEKSLADGQAQAVVDCLHKMDGTPEFTAQDIDDIKQLPVSVMTAIDEAIRQVQEHSKKA
jgi:hypothetical protein